MCDCHDIVIYLPQANVWLAAIGGSLQYGTMQAKTFRVYLIFRRPLKRKTVVGYVCKTSFLSEFRL